MSPQSHDSFQTHRTLKVGDRNYGYYSLEAASLKIGDVARLPVSLKVLLENLLRFEDGRSVTVDDVKGIAGWLAARKSDREIAFRPARVLMQDFTGVPAVVDLAAMRDAIAKAKGDPRKINPLSQVDLVIDHSVMVDKAGTADSYRANVELEYERNRERYEFLSWGQGAFNDFRVVPPGTGICHQVNLEYLAQTIWTKDIGGETLAFPDTLVGTDSHTTMVNGLAVLGWGVGGIEAEAAMLGQPISMLIPEVVGFRLHGELAEGATATDLVLTVTAMLRKKGVVGKFVEFFGPGIENLSLPDRATIANMAPEYGATCGFFPVDKETLRFLTFTGRNAARVALVEAYAKAQGLWRDDRTPDPIFSDMLKLDLSTVEPSLAGPRRPQDRVALSKVPASFTQTLSGALGGNGTGGASTMAEEGGLAPGAERSVPVEGKNFELKDGAVVIAAITSCTNTSNPSVMLGAGLLARNAVKRGLKVKPWVKTSLAPGSQVVTDYLIGAGVMPDLDKLGFNLVGYGCTTCIGNSGPLAPEIAAAVEHGKLVVAAVLSGNRNFEGRINPHVRANYLASPPLVVAYALAGTMTADLVRDPLGEGKDGRPVYLKDIWPSNAEIHKVLETTLTAEMFRRRYSNVFRGDALWQAVKATKGVSYEWKSDSTYVKRPPFFENLTSDPSSVTDVVGARLLAVLGDSVTTDHISPAGSIKKDSPAGKYLLEHGVTFADFNSYGARRGNHEVMMRGTFANIRLRNEMAPGTEGGVTRHMPDGAPMTIFDAAMRYAEEKTPLVIVAGLEYGTGSSRDWAAKGTRLLGVRAVIAESFERIHRSNLVGMGVLPLEFPSGTNRKTLELDGSETIDLTGLSTGIKPGMAVTCRISKPGKPPRMVTLRCRVDTLDEAEYYRHGGILQYVLRNLMAA